MAFKMKGFSPFDKEHSDKPDAGKGPEKIRITSRNSITNKRYDTGDMVSEDDFEASPSFGGGKFPQLSVQDYSNIKMDAKGAYVTKLK